MTTPKPERRPSARTALARDDGKRLASTVGRISGVVEIARTNAAMLLGRVPGTVHATRAGAHETASALQTLPDSTLRWLAATSVGLGAGFYLAGAPRLVAAAGVAPALILGAAIVLRPIEPVVPPVPTP
jgi:hypothetical protein